MSPPTFHASDYIGAPKRARGGLAFAWLLLFLACLPDAMLPPMLRQIVVERFGATEAQAHAFMSVNLVGALLAMPILYGLRRVLSPAILLAVAAAFNAGLLALLSRTGDFTAALVLRGLEGAADMTALAVLLHVAARAGSRSGRGRRLGASSTVLMMGLAAGAVIGGLMGRGGDGGGAQAVGSAGGPDPATAVLLAGAAACAVLAMLAIAGAGLINRTARDGAGSVPPIDAPAAAAPVAGPAARRTLWIPALMMGSDRMLAGLLTTTIPLLLATRLEWSPERIGGMVAVPLLIMAFGAYPAGLLADRLGNLRTRTLAALVYALSIAFVPVAGGISTPAMLVTLLVLGFAAAALMPTALSMAAGSGRGAAAMGTVQAAGNIGYFAGIAGAGWLLAELGGGGVPGAATYAMVIEIFALLHVVITGITLVEGARR